MQVRDTAKEKIVLLNEKYKIAERAEKMVDKLERSKTVELCFVGNKHYSLFGSGHVCNSFGVNVLLTTGNWS